MLTKLKLLFLAVLMVPAILVSSETSSGAGPAHDDQITRLYLTVLGRYPDPSGHEYWTERRVNGEPLTVLARSMIGTPEVAQRSSGDLVVDAYRNALLREPDAGGYEFWSQRPVWDAIVGISESPEHQQRTGTLPPPAPVVTPAPSSQVQASAVPSERDVLTEGWIDAGHGVFVPPILLRIRFCESTDNYLAANPRSSARGAYQFLTGSWSYYGHAARYGVAQAHLATPAQQDEAALLTWQAVGTSPWNASRHCWG
jgi:hypothetical protein